MRIDELIFDFNCQKFMDLSMGEFLIFYIHRCAVLSGQLVLACVQGGPVKLWGKPVDESSYTSAPYIDMLHHFSPIAPDFVLVDGRSIQSNKY